MLHFVITTSFWLHDIWHPLRGLGYQFWSGIAGCFITASIFGGVITHWRQINCHVPWCLRRGSFPLDKTPFKVCKKHHPDIPNNLTLEHIHEVYNKSK